MKGLFLAIFTAFLAIFTASATLAEELYRFPTTCSVVVEEEGLNSYSVSFSTTGSASSYSTWSCKNLDTQKFLGYGSFQENMDIPPTNVQPPFSCTVGVQGLKSTCHVTCAIWSAGATPICEAEAVSNN